MGDMVELEGYVKCYKSAVMADNGALADYFMRRVVNQVKLIVPTLDDLETKTVATMLVMMA